MDNAAAHLGLPYTYTIAAHGAKAKARETIGKMAVEICCIIRDELLENGVKAYLGSRGIKNEIIEQIFSKEVGHIEGGTIDSEQQIEQLENNHQEQGEANQS